MSQVWLVLRVDYEDCECWGVYSTQALAEMALELLWRRYQALPDEAREAAGPYGLQHAPCLTWEAFAQWHPLRVFDLDAPPVAYASPAHVEEATR